MSSVSPSTFGLHDAAPEVDLDPAWRPRVHQHDHTLAGMLQRMQTTVERVDRCPNALVLQALVVHAEPCLNQSTGDAYTAFR